MGSKIQTVEKVHHTSSVEVVSRPNDISQMVCVWVPMIGQPTPGPYSYSYCKTLALAGGGDLESVSFGHLSVVGGGWLVDER